MDNQPVQSERGVVVFEAKLLTTESYQVKPSENKPQLFLIIERAHTHSRTHQTVFSNNKDIGLRLHWLPDAQDGATTPRWTSRGSMALSSRLGSSWKVRIGGSFFFFSFVLCLLVLRFEAVTSDQVVFIVYNRTTMAWFYRLFDVWCLILKCSTYLYMYLRCSKIIFWDCSVL